MHLDDPQKFYDNFNDEANFVSHQIFNFRALRKLQNQPIRKTHDENDYMSYDTLQEFNSRKRWKLIIDNVIKNPEFYACVQSHERKKFSIK